MRLPRNAMFGLLLLACQPAHGGQPWVVGFDGVGPLRFGMSFDDVNARLGHRLKRTSPEQLATAGCDQVSLDGIGHKGIWLMFVDDVFRRVDVEAGARTAAGIAPGQPVRRVYAAYPKVDTQPRPYEEEAELSLTVLSRDGRRALRFETAKGKVDNFFAGDRAQVRWIEGCL
jgi:hypothetical protein